MTMMIIIMIIIEIISCYDALKNIYHLLYYNNIT